VRGWSPIEFTRAATDRPIVPASGDYDDGEIGGMMIGRETEVLGENVPSAALSTTNPTCCPDANPGRQRITAWPTARLNYTLSSSHENLGTRILRYCLTRLVYTHSVLIWRALKKNDVLFHAIKEFAWLGLDHMTTSARTQYVYLWIKLHFTVDSKFMLLKWDINNSRIVHGTKFCK
jgi:hypothetical protein